MSTIKLPRGRVPADAQKLHAYIKRVANENSVSYKVAEDFVKNRSNGVSSSPLAPVLPDIVTNETDEEIVKRISEQFEILYKCAKGTTIGAVRSLIVSGAGGTGKTHTIERILEHAKEHKNIQSEVVHGVLTAVNLYKLLYRNRTKNCVVVLDDADGIFKDENALTVLKAALDSGAVRKISWMSEGNALNKDDVPNEFLYEGSMIFITNLNFQQMVDSGKGSLIPHMQALMTRALYLDLKLHTQRELMVWINHMVSKHGILIQDGLTKEQQEDVLEFMRENRDKMRNLSIRTALKLASFVKLEGPKAWRTMAKHVELR